MADGIAYNLGNLSPRLALPKQIDTWSLTSLQQRLVKTGGCLIKRARYGVRRPKTEKFRFYISLARTHADVDRTLDACDQAFAAIHGETDIELCDLGGRL